MTTSALVEAVVAETAAIGAPRARDRRRTALRTLRDYVSLTKPRIVALLEFVALCAMVGAARGWPQWHLVVVTMLGGALAAGGANALNMWFDRDIDAAMVRTRTRPLPSGRIAAPRALVFGVVLGAAAFVVLSLGANLLTAVLAMAAYGFYVVVYTMYLKRSSMQNIVIGGAAGAVPPLVGWAAVTGHVGVLAIFAAAIVFYWTPPHFWTLALLVEGDYARAGVPMMPVVLGSRRTRIQIVLYTVLLVLVTLLPILSAQLGIIYGVGVTALDLVFVAGAVRLLRHHRGRAAAWLFHYSLVYLAAVFALVAADRVVLG